MIIRVPESAGKLYERIQYPAGELQVRFNKATIEELYKSESVTVLCRNAHQHLMELALLADALHYEVGHLESTLILPYLPYSRADRRFVEGDCHGLKTFGDIINQMMFSHVRTLDVHSFRAKKHVSRLQDMSARPFIERALKDTYEDSKGWTTILLPDEGSRSRYPFLNEYCDVDVQHASKVRDPATGKLSGFTVPSDMNNHILIVDDICDGGGTFVGLATAVNQQTACQATVAPYWNAELACTSEICHRSFPCWIHGDHYPRPKRKLYLYVTHGIFSKGLEPLLKHFEKIYTTNSICPFTREGNPYWFLNGLEMFDCEPELLGAVK